MHVDSSIMRAAVYARYSSDLQRETSIDDQVAVARRCAKDQGWSVLKDHLYTDAGISGASIQNRPGVQRLMAAAAQRPKPFDILLVDDSSRISRDIADAIRVMQQLKFLGVRVIYISQGIDSESEQADALVAVHGLIDSMYLKELAKKVKRGLAGQMDRGYSTGARQYGYDKVPVFDPSGATDPDGRPVVIGRRIQPNEEEATVIRRIFEWAAQGVGTSTIVDRLNREGIPGTGGKRWNKTPVVRILGNERYLGRQIWGQQAVEREPSTGRRIMRNRPRHEWKVVERPDLRIISDELWERTQATRQEVREAVAPKKSLARGKSGTHHSHHLLTGFTKCAVCGGAISSVSGGKGSPRFGCRRSWQEGLSACSNRLTIRIKVAEPQILAKLQAELQAPQALAYITKAVERELKKASAGPKRADQVRKRLDQEQRKLRNLVSALEGGAPALVTILKAIGEREASVAHLEGQLRAEPAKAPQAAVKDLPRWVEAQLGDLAALLKTDPARVKAEFRRLNLQLTFTPVEAEPRNHYVVKGQCDLSALAFSFVRPAKRVGRGSSGRMGAVVDLLGESQDPARSSWHGRSTS
jgi:site-specific DNA recombinase